ncbi:GL20474, partial [Drosophila persimilis]
PSGWHNIVDFNGRVTGGLEAHVEPLPPPGGTSMDTVIDQFEQSMELTHLHLGTGHQAKVHGAGTNLTKIAHTSGGRHGGGSDLSGVRCGCSTG